MKTLATKSEVGQPTTRVIPVSQAPSITRMYSELVGLSLVCLANGFGITLHSGLGARARGQLASQCQPLPLSHAMPWSSGITHRMTGLIFPVLVFAAATACGQSSGRGPLGFAGGWRLHCDHRHGADLKEYDFPFYRSYVATTLLCFMQNFRRGSLHRHVYVILAESSSRRSAAPLPGAVATNHRGKKTLKCRQPIVTQQVQSAVTRYRDQDWSPKSGISRTVRQSSGVT